MNTQFNENLYLCPKTCETDTLRNIGRNCGVDAVVDLNGDLWALVSIESSSASNEVTLEFLLLEKWVSDEWSESDVVTVVADKLPQEHFHGPTEVSLLPTDEYYDHLAEERSILDNAAEYLSKALKEREEMYA